MIMYQATMRHYLLLLSVFFLLLVQWAGSAIAVTWIDGSKARLQALDKITARISTVDAPVGRPGFLERWK